MKLQTQAAKALSDELHALDIRTRAAYERAEQVQSFLDSIILRVSSLDGIPSFEDDDAQESYGAEVADIQTQLQGIQTILEAAISDLITASSYRSHLSEHINELAFDTAESLPMK